MTCHKCPHDREIARLRETCAKCRLSDVAVNGTTSLDAITDGALETGQLQAKVAAGVSSVATFNPDELDAPADDAAGRVAPSMPEEAEEYVLELLRRFASMTLADVLVVHGLLRGWGIMRMADVYGESKQAISARVKKAMRRNPWLVSLEKSCRYNFRNEAERAADRTADADERTGAAWVKWCNLHRPTFAEAHGAGNGTRTARPCPSRPPRSGLLPEIPRWG